MRIIRPSVEIIVPGVVTGDDVLKHIEECGRICYQSSHKVEPGSAEKFVRMAIKRHHESVLEHFSFTVRFIVDRGVSHEIVRHRIASYSQESTRYCNYSKDRFGKEITMIDPLFYSADKEATNTKTRSEENLIWKSMCEGIETTYFKLLELGSTPQEARTVLPNSLKTEIVMTTNIREWRHFFRLRCARDAHPQMREVALDLLKKVHERFPVLFDDVYDEFFSGD